MFLTRLGFHSKAVVTGDITRSIYHPAASPAVEVRISFRDIAHYWFVYFDERMSCGINSSKIIKQYDPAFGCVRHPELTEKRRTSGKGATLRFTKAARSSSPPKGSWGQSHYAVVVGMQLTDSAPRNSQEARQSLFSRPSVKAGPPQPRNCGRRPDASLESNLSPSR